MHKGKYVFPQLLGFMIVKTSTISQRKIGATNMSRCSRLNQLCVLMFGQLSNHESLRDIVLAPRTRAYKVCLLGFDKHTVKSTVAYAYTKRDYCMFKLNRNFYIFNSTIADVCQHTFEWAFVQKTDGVKMHTLYNLETKIPTFFHTTPARVHETKATDVIHYEEIRSKS